MYLNVAGLFCKTQDTLLSGQISSCTGCIAPIINLLEPEFYIEILAHSVRKMRIIQEPKKVAL